MISRREGPVWDGGGFPAIKRVQGGSYQGNDCLLFPGSSPAVQRNACPHAPPPCPPCQPSFLWPRCLEHVLGETGFLVRPGPGLSPLRGARAHGLLGFCQAVHTRARMLTEHASDA